MREPTRLRTAALSCVVGIAGLAGAGLALGTWNFQLHPAFWFGMAMCDTQSYPEYTTVCKANSDSNIFDSAVGADFYPIYTTSAPQGECQWQLGGADLPGTQLNFGGTSTSEYGPLLLLAYAPANGSGQPSLRYNNFRSVLPNNPCPNSQGDE